MQHTDKNYENQINLIFQDACTFYHILTHRQYGHLNTILLNKLNILLKIPPGIAFECVTNKILRVINHEIKWKNFLIIRSKIFKIFGQIQITRKSKSKYVFVLYPRFYWTLNQRKSVFYFPHEQTTKG